jgi:predicted kinase
MNSPAMLLVHGEPCTGKTALATRLERDLGCVLLAKDAFKEPLFDELGSGDRAWSRRLSDIAWSRLFAVAGRSLRAGHTVIIEGNLRIPEHELQIAALRALTGNRCAQVLCRADEAVLNERRCARAAQGVRHPGHLDVELAAGSLAEAGTPTVLADVPVFEWDTSTPGGADYAALLTWLGEALREPPG